MYYVREDAAKHFAASGPESKTTQGRLQTPVHSWISAA